MLDSFYVNDRVPVKVQVEETKQMEFATVEMEDQEFFNSNMEHLARVHKDSLCNPDTEDQVQDDDKDYELSFIDPLTNKESKNLDDLTEKPSDVE